MVPPDGSGNITDRFLNGPAVDQILADEHYSSPVANPSTAGDTEWMLGDNQGTAHDIVDSSGLLDHSTYNAFGVLTGSGSFSATDAIFAAYTGSFYDSATGLVWDGHRLYVPPACKNGCKRIPAAWAPMQIRIATSAIAPRTRLTQVGSPPGHPKY